MDTSTNVAILLGRLGEDPVIRQTGSTAVANLSVATNERRPGPRGGEWREETTWHTVVVFGTFVAALREARKGDTVHVQGRMRNRTWQDQAGVERARMEVVVAGLAGSVVLLGRLAQQSSLQDNKSTILQEGAQDGQAVPLSRRDLRPPRARRLAVARRVIDLRRPPRADAEAR